MNERLMCIFECPVLQNIFPEHRALARALPVRLCAGDGYGWPKDGLHGGGRRCSGRDGHAMHRTLLPLLLQVSAAGVFRCHLSLVIIRRCQLLASL